MSNQTNTNLLDRAFGLSEELDSHPAGLDKLLDAAIKGGDLDQIRYWVGVCESTLSQQHFYENNLLEGRDEY